ACATSFSTPNASGHYVASPVQCVPYARAESGVQLYGDAHTWWNQAPGKYNYGHYPQPGAVLVLAQTQRMTHGHLAVVKNILNNREINVTHSNWGSDWKTRRIIYESMRVADASPGNDWSLVRFWNRDANTFGFPYQARGFIYR
ncbi:MAG TPA: CHAP domain-containing protein, partial [Alphaproteobacteria bacterium]